MGDLFRNFDLILRYLYPGILGTVYLIFLKSYSTGGVLNFIENLDSSTLTLLGLTLGIFLYSVYRGVIYFPIIRFIEFKTFGIPQIELHNKLVDELLPEEKKAFFKEFSVAHAVYSLVLKNTGYTDNFHNSNVHVLCFTGLFLLISSFIQIFVDVNIFICGLMFCLGVLLIFVSMVYDRFQADTREYIFLLYNQKDYKDVLTKIITLEGGAPPPKRKKILRV